METMNANATGNPIDRVDGRLKVTGGAKYTAEFPVTDAVYALGVNGSIAKGRIASIDTSEAERQKGVLKVITYKNADKLKRHSDDRPPFKLTTIAPVFQDSELHYYGQYVACVVAETFEQARYAGRLIKVTYDEDTPEIVLDKHKEESIPTR